MFRIVSRMLIALVPLTTAPGVAAAQADTTRRADSVRTAQPSDSARRTRLEASGEVDPRIGRGFTLDLPNYGLTSAQAIELQQALARVGCDVGRPDGVVGERTLRGLQCYRAQQPLTTAQIDSMLTALNVSFARPPAPVEAQTPPQREPTALPPVIRPDSTTRPDVRARRDSTLRRDSTARRDSLRRDTTTTRSPRR